MRPRRWPLFAGPAVALAAIAGMWLSATRAERAVRDEADAALARSAAAYLAVVTPPGPANGYDPARLLSAANALASSSFWHGGLQLALGQQPLLADTIGLLPVPDSVLEALDQGADRVLVTHARQRSALVPFLDRDRFGRLGWAAAWHTVSGHLPSAVVLGLTILAVAALGFAFAAFLGEHDRRWRVIALAAALGIALVLAVALGWSVYRTAHTATQARLLTTKRLIETAATAPGVRQAELPEIATGFRTRAVNVAVRPSDDVARGEDENGPYARVVAATPRTLGGLALTLRPMEDELTEFDLALTAWLCLVGLALGFTSWAARARLDAHRFQTTVAAWTFLAPALLHLLIFSALPALFTAWLAFHRWDLLGAARPFVGLANFRAAFLDGRFLHSLGVTALYTLQVPVSLALALVAAVLLDQAGVGIRLLRTILFLPFVSSVVAVALVWQWLYQPDAGLLNAGLGLLGIRGPDWLGDPRTALPSLMLMAVWAQVGYQMVVFLGGLQGIPSSYYDAARVDGAGPVRRFFWVTLPLLRPTVLFVLVTGVISSFQVFTYVAVMTDGGPIHATDVAVFRIYQEAWEFLRFGTASAMSLVLLVILLAFTWLQFRLLSKRVELV